MNLEEMRKRREELLTELRSNKQVTAERFAEIRSEVEKLDFQIAEAEKDEKRATEATEEKRRKEQQEAEERAARPANPGAGAGVSNLARAALGLDGAGVSTVRSTAAREEMEKRGKSLKAGEPVVFKRSITTGVMPLATHVDPNIVPGFAQVGTIDTLVTTESLPGGEGDRVAFEKTIAEGGITEEGKDYSDAEPTFGYADISRVKITAYAEISEEAIKLPDADYDSKVYQAVMGALRKKKISQMFRGTGVKSFVGIFNAPAETIEAKCRITIPKIDENTLDNFLYDYGGDESVEGDAYIIMNKLTLKEFAKVKGSDKKKAYEITLRGNTGTINTIPFVLTSQVPAFAVADAVTPYIVYGKLSAYKIASFSDIDVQRSTEYKFKQGMVAYRASEICGGAPVMFNGFLSIVKGSAAE